MRFFLTLILSLHLANLTLCVQAFGALAGQHEASHESDCPGDEPGSEAPCSDHCGGCARCPVLSDLPAPIAQVLPFSLPEDQTAHGQTAPPSRLLADAIFRPPRLGTLA